MFDGLAVWVPTLLLSAIAAKFWMEPRGYRLRFLPLKLALVAAAVVAIFISYGAIKGIEPGVSLIIVLMSLKIFEAHTVREFHFMVMLGWVLCLCGFFLAQDLAIAVCIMIAFTLLTTALVQFYRGLAAGRIWPPLRGALTLLAQAVPLIVLLFLLFPRVTTGFRLLLTPNLTSASGFSDRLSPGSVETLASSRAVAFRVEFPDGNVPRAAALYWRGLVMTQGDGMEWRSRDTQPAMPHPSQELRSGNTVRQWITIEPHGERWMFALDRPVTASPGAFLTPGNYLWSWQPIICSRCRRRSARGSANSRNRGGRPIRIRMQSSDALSIFSKPNASAIRFLRANTRGMTSRNFCFVDVSASANITRPASQP
ncbi:MAG: hypothetical protein DME32_11980 [Verrucomicrobia bacterium]|nr:MAG: hypothetical protein DME32_11980 [Verrucomicrobiota bacterium]